MITSSFFGTTSNRTSISWITPSNLGEINTSDIVFTLRTNLPCTYEIISASESNTVVGFILNDELIISGNPADNSEASFTVLASYGVLSSLRTFTFVCKRLPPRFITESVIQLPSSPYIDYQLLINEPRVLDEYMIIAGELPNGLELTLDGRIVGNNLFDNTISCITVEVNDGIYKATKQFTFSSVPNVYVFDVPNTNTVDAYGTNKGPFVINDEWLASLGWDGVYADITVNISDRYFPNDGYSTEGMGWQDASTITVDVRKQCTLKLINNGSISGSWGLGGTDDSRNGTNGGVALQILSPCTIINYGSIGGGPGGGGASGSSDTTPGSGGYGGAAIDIRSMNVQIQNHGVIAGGGGGGAGGWCNDITASSGYNGVNIVGTGGSGGHGNLTIAVGGVGGYAGYPGYNSEPVNDVIAPGGPPGYAIISDFPYSMDNVGSIKGVIDKF